MEVLPRDLHGYIEINEEKHEIDGVPAEIRTEKLANTSLQLHSYCWNFNISQFLHIWRCAPVLTVTCNETRVVRIFNSIAVLLCSGVIYDLVVRP
jgi:hypothetical protein